VVILTEIEALPITTTWMTKVRMTVFAIVALNATTAAKAQQKYTTPSPAQSAPTAHAAPAQTTYRPTYQQPTYRPTYQAAPAVGGGDPYGFTSWLNGVRAQYGLSAVGYDAGLSGWAAQNNAQQSARGLGHHVMGPARRQNSAMAQSYAQIGAMWLASPSHRAALLDPTIRNIGIAGAGAYWTYNAQ
jgi:uncharacterized protein YkwD